MLDQIAPVNGTYYTVLDTTKNVRLYTWGVKQVNDEANTKNTRLEMLIDGVTITWSDSALPNNSLRLPYLVGYVDGAAGSSAYNVCLFTALEGKSIKIITRISSAAGTNQHLYGYVRYATQELIPS